jgi:hypothetical protein
MVLIPVTANFRNILSYVIIYHRIAGDYPKTADEIFNFKKIQLIF